MTQTQRDGSKKGAVRWQ